VTEGSDVGASGEGLVPRGDGKGAGGALTPYSATLGDGHPKRHPVVES
jgi:hypothetical protein